MDITVGSVVTNNTGSAVSPLVVAFTNLTGGFVCVDVEVASTTDVVTAVTYAGIAMTKVGVIINIDTLNTFSRWILNNAPYGNESYNISVTFSGTPNTLVNAVSYAGVQSTGQPDNTNITIWPASANTAMPFVPVADRCWILAVCNDSNANTLTAAANCVARANQTNFVSFDTNGPWVPGNSMTVSHTSVTLGAIMMSISPVPPVAGTPAKAKLDPQRIDGQIPC